MNIFSIIFLCLSVIIAGLHFFFIYKNNDLGRCFTKPFIILFLAIALCIAIPDKPLIWVGAFLGAIGDALLIKKTDKTFLLFGTLAFLLGHIAYFVAFCTVLTSHGISIPFWTFIVIVSSLVVTSLFCYPFLYHIIKKQCIPFTIYILIAISMAICSIQLFFVVNNPASGICFLLGYLTFIFSDIFLGYTLFVKDVKNKNYVIMGSYVVAQYLVTAGLFIALI